MSGLVFAGDGIDGLALYEHGSVGLILSDLPSGETRAPFDRVPNATTILGGGLGSPSR